MTKKISGFGLVGALIIFLAVAAVGTAGYFVYQSNNSSDAKTAEEMNHEKMGHTTTTDAGEFLVIAEWEAQVPLNDFVKGLYYKEDDELGLGFRTTELDELTEDCDKSTIWIQHGKADDYYNGVVGTVKFAAEYEARETGGSPQFHKLIGEDYFLSSAPGGVCLQDASDSIVAGQIVGVLDKLELTK